MVKLEGKKAIISLSLGSVVYGACAIINAVHPGTVPAELQNTILAVFVVLFGIFGKAGLNRVEKLIKDNVGLDVDVEVKNGK